MIIVDENISGAPPKMQNNGNSGHFSIAPYIVNCYRSSKFAIAKVVAFNLFATILYRIFTLVNGFF